MSDKKPVVVYGASGYTGRLVCEYLREYGLPFIAAGRSADRVNEVIRVSVEVPYDKLVERQGIFYEVNSTIRFTGTSVEYYVDTIIKDDFK